MKDRLNTLIEEAQAEFVRANKTIGGKKRADDLEALVQDLLVKLTLEVHRG